ncbi:MAG: hypothetical protein CMM46_10550 [Rhodospirillaceae bacterium]|nr:hypothetical protein [Rhodospirillaceae bacterium]|tara:strand:- start:89 stop:280 length:192 start_codon:yes stop_codon:yes gene_type:complete
MTLTLILIGSQIAALAGGLVAGLFLIFSDFMMRALRLATPAAGIEVMQTLNREIYRSATMVLL